MTGLTDRQREVLAFVAARSRGVGAPSMREVARHFGFASLNGINDFYEALIRKGVLARDALKSRAVRVTEAGWRALGFASCSHCSGSGRVSA